MSVAPRLVASRQAILAAASSSDSSPVYGLARLSESLIQILSSEPWPDGQLEELGIATRKPIHPGSLILSVDGNEYALKLRHGLPRPNEVHLVDVEEGLDSRRIRPSTGMSLAERSVLLVGAGSVGSQVGLLLAEAGVGRFGIVDNDTLDAANLSRHAGDLMDLARPKVRVVADLLKRRLAHGDGHDIDLLTLSEADLDKLIGASDVVVASTDSPAAQFRGKRKLHRTNTPGIFIGAYERASGGEIIVVRPGQGPCAFCAIGFRLGLGEGVSVKERRQAYQSADTERLEAEPGLGADIAYLSAVATAHVLALLDPMGSRADLVASGHEFLLLHGGSVPQGGLAELFNMPFDLIHARVARREPCPVCGWKTDSEAGCNEL